MKAEVLQAGGEFGMLKGAATMSVDAKRAFLMFKLLLVPRKELFLARYSFKWSNKFS